MAYSPLLRSIVLGLGLTATFVATAQAADLQVIAQSPMKNGLTTWPSQIHLTFNEPLKTTGADVQLQDPDGRRIRLTMPVPAKDGLTVATQLTGGPPVLGPYLVTWQANAASGQSAKGFYTFFLEQ